MSDLPYKSWKHTPLDPSPPPPNSPAARVPPPSAVPFYRVFQAALLRNRGWAEVMMAAALVGAGVAWWRQRPASAEDEDSNAAGAGSGGGVVERGDADSRYQQVQVVRERQ